MGRGLAHFAALVSTSGCVVSACLVWTSTDGFTGGAPGADASTDGSDAAAPDGSDAANGDGATRTYRDEVLADEPLAYWRLGEQTGTTAKDESGNGNDGTYIGAFALGAAGAVGDGDTAVALSGGYVDVRDKLGFPGNQPFSLEAWVDPAAGSAGYRSILTKAHVDVSGPTAGYLLSLRPTDQSGCLYAELDLDSGKVPLCSPSAPPAGTYTHVVLTYDGHALATLYANGAQVTSASTTGAIPVTTESFVIGGPFNQFGGSIDEAAVYDHVLTPERVSIHYRAGIKGP